MPCRRATGSRSTRSSACFGAGGFGITCLANDTKLDGPVALKEYFPREHAERAADQRVAALPAEESRALFTWGLDRFLDEARSIHRFRHPNVVRVHRYVEALGTACIVMEYVEGESVDAVLRGRAPLPAAEWRRCLDRLLDGLEHVHGHGYVHRDIAPANIVIRTANGEPVFIDFGAARAAPRGAQDDCRQRRVIVRLDDARHHVAPRGRRLDLIADCTKRTLTPRYEDYPLLKLKALGTRRQFCP